MQEELNQPNNTEKEIDLVALFRKIWKQRLPILKYAGYGALAGLVIAFSIPKEYNTSITLALENSANTQGKMSGLANLAGINLGENATPGITSEIYPDIIKSRPFLLEFADIRVTDPKGREMPFIDYINNDQKKAWWNYVIGFPGTVLKWIRPEKPEEKSTADNSYLLSKESRKFIKSLEERLNASSNKKNNLLTISSTMQDPFISALIADSMFSKLQRYVVAYQTNKTKEDLNISIKLYEEAKQRYYDTEDSLARAMDQNRNIVSNQWKVKVIDRWNNERNLAYGIYNQTAQQMESNKMKLQNETPIATIIEPAVIPDKPASPNKKVIFIAFIFLGTFVKIGIILFRDFFPASPDSETQTDEA